MCAIFLLQILEADSELKRVVQNCLPEREIEVCSKGIACFRKEMSAILLLQILDADSELKPVVQNCLPEREIEVCSKGIACFRKEMSATFFRCRFGMQIRN